MDEKANIVELIDENNEMVAFEHIMTLDYGDNEYVVLAPIEETDENNEAIDEGEIVILRVELDEDGNDFYTSIDDEDELEEVFAAVTEVYSKSLD